MELKTPSLKELASAISSQSSIVNEFLEKNALPQPSFAPYGLRNWEDADGEVQAARMQLIEAATDILHLAMGPSEYIKFNALTQKFDQFAIGALNEWKVFDAVPLRGSITYAELAKKVNIPEARLRRVLRHAISDHVFWAPTRDSVSHTSASAEVVRDPLLFAWLGHNFDEITPGTEKILKAMEKYGESEKPEHAGTMIAYGKEEVPFFEWIDIDGTGEPPKEVSEGKVVNDDRTKGWRARRFGNAMKCMMQSGTHASSHATAGFDWGNLGKAIVVDVGGSVGHVSVEIAAANPDLLLIVQDFATLKPQFDATVPQELKPRITFQAHDFFNPQPIKGADVYFFKHILHDWPDFKCVEILRNVVSAMKKGNRIVVMDGVMPELGEASNFVLRMNSSFDLQMMAALNAKERRKEVWENLFREADERLVVKGFRQPPGSAATLIEVVFEG